MKQTYFALQQTGLFLLLGLLTLSGCNRELQPSDSTQTSGGRIRIRQTITEIVVASPDFTLLKAAVVKAGLAEALSTGNLTVFAPTDNAFRAAGFGDVNAINNADVNVLRRILLYHVIGTERFFEDRIPDRLTGFKTLQGEQVYATRRGGLSVNGVPVDRVDVEANNGVIHIISRVLLPPAGNTIEVAVANPNLTYLVAALQRVTQSGTNLIQVLGTGGPFTVFAPTNAAFQAAGFSTIESVRAADPNVLSRILRYHVVPGITFSTQLNDEKLMTVEGGGLTATRTPGMAIIQGIGNTSPAKVQAADIVTLNGVVHVIDQVLLPTGNSMTKSITNLVVENPNFSLLKAAVVRAGLADALSTGTLTVFAPTDDAFRAAGLTDVNAINNMDINVLRKILLYHVIGGESFFANALPENILGFKTLQGEQLQISKRQSITVNGVYVIQADIKASNGVVHVINKVLLPPAGNLVEVAVSNPNLSFLVAAVQRAGLVQTLGTGGPFTVFAPTNAAFQAAGFPSIQSIQAADPAVLAKILTYHVVSGRAFSTTLRSDDITTVQGGTLSVMVTPKSSVMVSGKSNSTAANVVIADLVTLNGIVHVIDRVLLP
ncbi:fasciclin domain-containing protein [Arsenicibacter rosenii]|uniref:FAS1 domain-containing protein n=1 Tax=Arsenicibacter rosenii TaxID=1750698 RepID=A0A1S2VHW0_9BACT|nr:fasciclin domain-containing protein [Arsenicibacter rosenii]OIN58332.1 hypothetical protein BLX24_15170 [Arsenicibacter rosenii]